MTFQSAPLTGARGDAARWSCLSLAWFQSAPLTGARGDAVSGWYTGDLSVVSIRSPDRSQGRRIRINRVKSIIPVSIRSPDRSQGRPPGAGIAPARHRRVSIRSPDRSQGRRATRSAVSMPAVFQSAPLTGSQGRRRSASNPCVWIEFQSAPLTGARGDAGCCNQRNSRQLPK